MTARARSKRQVKTAREGEAALDIGWRGAVGDCYAVGEGFRVGETPVVGVPPCADPFWQAANRPVNPPRTLSLRKSRRLVSPG
ncbi:MAG TPA: hypothetical protein VNE38_21260 [Ktedonobacteraceae bacterium]|nr:hypothetical protein [Ktedonobacteraceae bacterium]